MNRPIRVAYYQITLGPAHHARIAALDAQDGIECRGVALAAGESTRREADDASIERLESDQVMPGRYEEIPLYRRITAAIRHLGQSDPDAIILDSPADPVQFILGRWAQAKGVLVFSRWAATIRDHPRSWWKESLKRPIYRGWDGYLVTGQRGLDYLRTFGVPEERSFVCGNPVDQAAIERLAQPLENAERKPHFLFVGRFLKLKNLPRFLRAFIRYRQAGGEHALRVVGFGEDEASVRSLAAGRDEIELLGHRSLPDLVREYAECSAFVLPSYSENWGLVVNEAMLMGAPVIASSVLGCIPELLEDNQSGLVFDPMSESSMAEVLHRFDEMSSDERSALAKNARSRVDSQGPGNWAVGVARAIKERAGRETGGECR